MPALIPEPLRRIRHRFPTAKCDARTWVVIDKLASSGNAAQIRQAEALAKECTFRTPATRSLHRSAKRSREAQRQFLIAQRKSESTINKSFSDMADKSAIVLSRNEDDEGEIPVGRARRVIAAIDDLNAEAYREISSEFRRFFREAVRRGIRSIQSQSRVGVDLFSSLTAQASKVKEVEEDPTDPLKAKIAFGAGATIFKRIFQGTLRDTMSAGLFGKTGVSNRVFDLRDNNRTRLHSLVSAGISQGKSAASISRDIRGLLIQPKTLRGAARDNSRPGVGVYRSAFRNASRLTRTETNRAYVFAGDKFAEEKKWKLMWQVSTGQRDRDSCDALHGRIMTPEEHRRLYPQHPHELCYTTIVMPKVSTPGSTSGQVAA